MGSEVIKKLVLEMMESSCKGLIDCVKKDMIDSPEWVLHRNFIINCANYFESCKKKE